MRPRPSRPRPRRRWPFRAPVLAAAVSAALPAVAAAQFRDLTSRIPPGTETTIGVSWTDFDGDGDFDLFATTYNNVPGDERNRLLENRGSAGFVAVDAPPLELAPFLSTAAAWGDFDDDGDADVFIASETDSAASLFRNDGGGAFVDVTPPVLRTRAGCYTAVWVDHDLDGDLDLSVASREGGKLFRNDGAGSFADVTPGLLSARTWCLEWSDYDVDGDPDVFLGTVQSDQGAPLILARNDGGNRFVDVAAGTLGGGDDGAFSGDFADYDGDGDLDLYVTYFVTPAQLFRNDGAAGFLDVTPQLLRGTGASYSAMWTDYDNDGDSDVLRCGLLSGGTALYRNDGGLFSDASAQLLGARQAVNWSAAWGDWDADGRQDLYLGQAGTSSDALLRNETSLLNHWLGVELEGVLSNRRGLGARIEVTTAGGGTRIGEISGGGDGWCSQEPPVAWFGLGRSTAANVTVYWPSGQRQVVNGVEVDRRITVREPGLVPIDPAYPAGERYDVDFLLSGARITPAGSPMLHLRRAGSGAPFVAVPLVPIGGLFLRGAIDDSLTTTAGIEYYVEYALGTGTRRMTPFAGAAGPSFLPADFGRLAAPDPPPTERFVMYGFPFAMSDSLDTGALAEQLGEPDPVRWRAGRWDPLLAAYREAPDSAFVVRSGEAFWMVSRLPVAPAAGGRTSDPSGVSIPVRPGWNQIAHPFQFPVALADVDFTRAPNVSRRAVGYRGGYYEASTLEPWRGFWMYNGSLSSQTIVIPGIPASAAARGPGPAPMGDAPDWMLTVDATQGDSWDRGNEAAVAGGALDGAGPEDLREPPEVPGQLRVWFEAPDPLAVKQDLTRDVRDAAGEGHVWDLLVRGAEGGGAVALAFGGVAGLPARLDAALVPEETQAFIDLRGRAALELPASGTRRFRLVVGTPSFVSDVRSGVVLAPDQASMGLAWPNPFAADTRVAFALPDGGAVNVSVYDVTGRLVRTLVSGPLPAGRHRLEWGGTDAAGRSVASGVYFLKMRAGDATFARKVVLRR